MEESEAEQLRQEIQDLHSLIDTVAGRRSGDRVLVESCEEAIRERRERLEALERKEAPAYDA
jgi:chromosome segregation ATPase